MYFLPGLLSQTQFKNQAPFYEVYFLKFHLLEENLAIWIRYTLHAPLHKEAYAALWVIGMYKDKPEENFYSYNHYPLNSIQFNADPLSIVFPHAYLEKGRIKGNISKPNLNFEWNLNFSPEPLFASADENGSYFYPHLKWYQRSFPKTKYHNPWPSLFFSGSLEINQKRIDVSRVKGSLGHIWGIKHGLRWAWAHANIFEKLDTPFTFEALAAQTKAAGITLPYLKIFNIRSNKSAYLYNQAKQWLKNKSKINLLDSWNFQMEDEQYLWLGEIKTDPKRMLTLRYTDPDGSHRYCHHDEWATLNLQHYEKQNLSEKKLLQEYQSLATSFEWVDLKADSRIKVAIEG